MENWYNDIKEEQLDNLSDEEIVQIAKQDILVLEYLYQKYNYLIFSKSQVYYFVGADLSDVMQEARIGFYKAVRDFRDGFNCSFKSFANMCVNRHLISVVKTMNNQKNEILNHSVSLEKQIRHGDTEFKLLDVLIDNQLKEPEALYIFNETQRELAKKIIVRLSKLELLVISHVLEGYNYREIAEKLNKEPKAIDNALQRARRKMAKLLMEKSLDKK